MGNETDDNGDMKDDSRMSGLSYGSFMLVSWFIFVVGFGFGLAVGTKLLGGQNKGIFIVAFVTAIIMNAGFLRLCGPRHQKRAKFAPKKSSALMNTDLRSRAAKAARAAISNEKEFSDFVSEFGESGDSIIEELVDLIEHAPERDGVLGAGESVWKAHYDKIQAAIGALEK